MLSFQHYAVASLRRSLIVVAAASLLAGCASMPDAQALRAQAAPYPGTSLPVTLDGRARYRQIFCAMVARASASQATTDSCDDLLWRLRDEGTAVIPAAPLPEPAPGLQIFVVSGAFSDCREPATIPFEEAITRLSAAGVKIRPVMVSGRSSPAHNARQIADAFASAGIAPGDRVVLVGYSKGAVDALQFLVDYPEQARQVAAVISIAGAIQGSPLAEQGDWWYRTFLQEAFPKTCDPGDGQVIASLLPATRTQWLVEHPLPAHVAYYSLAAFPTAEHLSHGLELTWRSLARHDRRNDGQILAGDAIIPGSTVLGYVNADHWDLAIALEQQMPHLSGRSSPRHLPRSAILEAALLYMSERLQPGEESGAATRAARP